MTDAHCHVSCGDASVREFLVGRDFVGVHPWDADAVVLADLEAGLRAQFTPMHVGVGEIGLDRLKDRAVSETMRRVFETQLRLAVEWGVPVVLHGAKCWGQVVQTFRAAVASFPTTNHQPRATVPLFHGFSRSDGLIPDIVALGGFISVGPAVLNDHAVNYRELVKKIPLDRLLIETDRTAENATTCPSVREVLAKTAEIRGISADELESLTDANADRFVGCAPHPEGRTNR